jgi:hypothetical protein
MNGIIIEVNKRKAVVMIENYGIKTVKNKNYDIGDCIQICDKPSSAHFSFKKYTAIFTAIIFIVFIGIFSVNFYDKNYTESYSVTVDINPLIKFYANDNNKLIKIEPLNSDAKILDLKELNNKNINEALKLYITICYDAGYINENVIINIIVDNLKNETESQKITNNARDAILLQLAEKEINGTVNTRIIGINDKKY